MSGKGNHFPLADETKRAGDIGEEDGEAALLINPCEDDPEDFLAFEIRDGLCIAVPRPGGADPFGRGRHSIRIYGLNRKELVQERTERVAEVDKALQSIRDNLDILAAVAPSSLPAEKATNGIKRELDAVRRYVSPRARYTAAALALVIEHVQLLREAADAVAVAPVV
jgi:hypothetical protein